jgi:AcrR family transcriptional regulator
MAGLRAKQKADKTRRILEAATALFRNQGYDSARIEDIAELAEVSVGTLYNYYQNKGDILVATVAMEVTEVLEAGARLVANPPLNVAEALHTLVNQYYDHSLVYLSKEMWRAAMAISIQQPETPLSRRYTELDGQLCAQVVQLVETLKSRGVVHAGVDAKAMGEVFFNNLNMMFIEFCKVDAMPLEELKARVAAQHGPVASLISSIKIV